VFSRPVMLGAISLDLFAVLFGGAIAMLPAVARDILHTDATGLGLLRCAPAVGSALTTAVLAFKPIERRIGHWMFAGVALFGAATILFGLSSTLYLSVAALMLTGVGDMVRSWCSRKRRTRFAAGSARSARSSSARPMNWVSSNRAPALRS